MMSSTSASSQWPTMMHRQARIVSAPLDGLASMPIGNPQILWVLRAFERGFRPILAPEATLDEPQSKNVYFNAG
jgi:hypothetical protein